MTDSGVQNTKVWDCVPVTNKPIDSDYPHWFRRYCDYIMRMGEEGEAQKHNSEIQKIHKKGNYTIVSKVHDSGFCKRSHNKDLKARVEKIKEWLRKK